MKDFLKENSKYKIVAKLSIISVTTLLMMFAGTASIGSHYHSVYAAAKNATSSSSSSTSKGGGSSSINSTSPIGSSAFLNVITKVDNINGGMAKPSDFTITRSGKSPSPKSFSGSTSGTSVTLKAGKYKVTGSGPSGYNIAYSSGCSGAASGGVPVKCTVSSSFSKTISGNSTYTTNKTKAADIGIMKINGFVRRPDCSNIFSKRCPEVSDNDVSVTNVGIDQEGGHHYYPYYWHGELGNEPRQISIPVGMPYAVVVEKPFWDGNKYPETFWRWEAAYIKGSCTGTNLCEGTMTANGATVEVNLHWGCLGSPYGRC